MRRFFASHPNQMVPMVPMTNPRQRVTVVDIKMKRKSGSCNVDVGGSAFLNPGRARNNHIPFFRRPDIDLSVRDMTVRINSLSPDQQNLLAQRLGLKPTQAALWAYMRDVQLSDKKTIHNIQNILNEITLPMGARVLPPPPAKAAPTIMKPAKRKESKAKMPKLGPISSYSFVDIRYSYCDQEGMVLKDAVLIGTEKFEMKLSVPDLPPSMRVVIQCFTVGMVPAIIRWPSTSQIVVNDVPVKLTGLCNFPLIDASEFGERPEIEITCNNEGTPYALVVRVAKYRSFSEIADEVRADQVDNTPFSGQAVPSVMDPVSGKLMKYPGKGVNCTHDQCFDIKQFLKRCNRTRQWACPICNKPLPIHELRLCAKMAEVISVAKSQRGSPSAAVKPDESRQESFDDSLVMNSDGDVFPDFNDPEGSPPWDM